MRQSFSDTSDSLPTISPLLARAITPLPLLPLEIVLAGFLQRICRRNPEVFDRLGQHAGKRFGIRPTDLPLAFVVEASPRRPRLSVVRTLPPDVDASIASTLFNLLALLEGRLDGDALMFSRQLVIEGDVEAVLALRNAIDDAQLDLTTEASSLFGPLAEPVRRILAAARASVLPDSRPEEVGSWS